MFMYVCVCEEGGRGRGRGDPPRSLLFIMALEPRRRGPCWVKWYPNFSRVVFFSSMLAISISTLFPSGWLWGEKERERGEARRGGIEAPGRTPAVKKKRTRRWAPTHTPGCLSSAPAAWCCAAATRSGPGFPSPWWSWTPRSGSSGSCSLSASLPEPEKSTKRWQSLTAATAIFGICLPRWHRRVKNNSSKLVVYRYNKWIWRAWRTKQTCTRDSRTQQGRCSWFLRCWTSPPPCSWSGPRRTTSGSWWGCSECGKRNPNKTPQLSRTSFGVSHRACVSLATRSTLILLRLTSTRSGSFLFNLNRVSSTSVELGSSSGTGLYWVHWMTPATCSHRGRSGKKKDKHHLKFCPTCCVSQHRWIYLLNFLELIRGSNS